MKIKTLLFFFMFVVSLINAQTPAFQWVKTYSAQPDWVSCDLIRTDLQGNIITAGSFQSVTDFDPGPAIYTLAPTGTGYDGYVCKLDMNGNFLWARQLNGQYNNFINSMQVDNVGNIYSTGAYYTTTLQATTYDGFVWKLSPSGNTVFMALMGGSVFDNGIGLCLDQQKNIYSTGIISSTNGDFDPGPGTFFLSGSADGYLSKLDSSGNFVWAGVVNCSGWILEDWSITESAGYIYHCGRFNGSADFDPGLSVTTLTADGNYDGFVSKLDNNGNFIWAKLIGSPKEDIASRIITDSNGDLIVMGNYDSIADLDPGPGTYTVDATVSGSTYIIKLDTSGNLIWAKTLFPAIREFHIDANNNIYTTGTLYSWNSPTDMDPGPGAFSLTPSSNSNDAYMSKLSANGNFMWAVMLEDTGYSGGSDIYPDNLGNLFTVGNFAGRVDFDPSASAYTVATTNTVSNAFIHKMNVLPVGMKGVIKNERGVKIYPNPFSQKLNVLLPAEAKETIITIYNLNGQVVFSHRYFSNWFIAIEPGNLPHGAYFIEVNSDGEVTRHKVVKQ